VVLSATQDESLWYHNVQIYEVGHDSCARGYLRVRTTRRT
jgi:hypothetical protein